MSLVYSAKNDGVYVSFDVEFQINHIATIINAIRYIVSAVAGVVGGQGKKI